MGSRLMQLPPSLLPFAPPPILHETSPVLCIGAVLKLTSEKLKFVQTSDLEQVRVIVVTADSHWESFGPGQKSKLTPFPTPLTTSKDTG